LFRRNRFGHVIGALIAALVTSIPGSAGAVWPFDAAANDRAEAAADLLSSMIRIQTVNPPGAEGALAEYIVDYLKSRKIEARSIPTPTRKGDPPRAAVYARVSGNGSARPLVLLSHLDVVPALASEWAEDPFSGRVEDGYVHGRGAMDAKGVTAIQLLSLIAVAERETPLDRDIILLATPDEEAGGRDGAGYLTAEHPELFEDAEFLLTEGGSIRPGGPGAPDGPSRPSMWGVTVTEKSPCWLALTASGTPGHGSAPRSDAAVPRLIAALDRVRRVESPVKVLGEVDRMFLALSSTAAKEDRAGFASLSTALEENSSFKRRFLANPGYNALVRNTVSITVLSGGSRTNVVPGTARAELDVRLLPGERCSDFTRSIRQVVADDQMKIETLLAFPSRSSASDTALFQAIRRVARAHDPRALVIPRMIGGFTDAHWFRERGIVSYGFVPRWLSSKDTRGIHGADERVSIENLTRGVATLIEILEAIDQPPALSSNADSETPGPASPAEGP
jgi:acetylornithine deacetylase/succinyl-diaminopimelate desuccinylase-like protein